MKDNITDLGYGLETLLKLRAVEFDWLDQKTHGDRHQLGFIAQEVVNVIPDIVRGDESSKTLGLESIQIIPVLVKAVQELTARVAQLEQG
jgi:hypothetical protein